MPELELLTQLLRPAGNGAYPSAGGVRSLLPLQRAIYRVERDEEIPLGWAKALRGLEGARLVILGVPSDTGAGPVRGSSAGPEAIRRALLDSWIYRDPRIIDAGDVAVVPQLLHDGMLSEAQLRSTRNELYGDPERPLPVSPLSIAERAIQIVGAEAKGAAILVLGGDNSVSLPAVKVIAETDPGLGVLHFDAHPDLLPHRLGVPFCFGTWAYHASRALRSPDRFVQVGLRASRRDRAAWEKELGVRQYWMGESCSAEQIADDFARAGVERVYVSNDIDGTDPEYAGATGMPEPGGLSPELVIELIAKIGARFPIVGSDLVEVAPSLTFGRNDEPATTLHTAVRYIEAQAATSLGGRP